MQQWIFKGFTVPSVHGEANPPLGIPRTLTVMNLGLKPSVSVNMTGGVKDGLKGWEKWKRNIHGLDKTEVEARVWNLWWRFWKHPTIAVSFGGNIGFYEIFPEICTRIRLKVAPVASRPLGIVERHACDSQVTNFIVGGSNSVLSQNPGPKTPNSGP